MNSVERAVEYLRQNMGKYSVDSLKQVLMQGGIAPAEIEEALRIVSLPSPVEPDPGAEFRALSVPAKVKGLLLSPGAYFGSMPKKGGLREPFVFLFTMVAAAQCVSLVLGAGPRLLGWVGSPLAGAGTGFVLAMIAGAAAGLVLLPLFTAGLSLGAHLIWMLLGSKEDFETSFRCLAYMSPVLVLHAAAHAFPGFGFWASIPVVLYAIFLFVPAGTRGHGIRPGRAAAVSGVFAVLFAGGIAASAYAVWKFKSVAEELGSGGPEGAARIEKFARALAKAPGARVGFTMRTESGGYAPPFVPADPEALKGLLPESAAGLPRSAADAGTTRFGELETVEAAGTYRGGDRRIRIAVADAGPMAPMFASAWRTAAANEKNAAGFERIIEFQGHPGHERFRKEGGEAKLELVAFGRFLIRAEGRGVSMEELEGAVGAIPFTRLMALTY